MNYHRVLNRAVWSSLAVSRVLLLMLIGIFAPFGPIVMGLDDTIERRRGEKIKASGTTVTQSVPVTVTSSKRVDCAG